MIIEKISMYWKHVKKKKYCILFNFDRIIFIKIHP